MFPEFNAYYNVVEYSERNYSEEELDEILDKAFDLGLNDDPQLDFITIDEMDRLVNYIV